MADEVLVQPTEPSEPNVMDFVRLYSEVDYSVEQDIRKREYLTSMLQQGYDKRNLDIEYPIFAINQTPTFSTTREENGQLNDMLMAVEFMNNPQLQESIPHQEAYTKYVDRRFSDAATTSMLLEVPRKITSKIATTASQLGEKYLNLSAFAEEEELLGSELNHDAKKAFDWAKDVQQLYKPDASKATGGAETLIELTALIADAVVINKVIGTNAKSLAKAAIAKNPAEATGKLNKVMAKMFIDYGTANKKMPSVTMMNLVGQLAEDVQVGTAFVMRDIAISKTLKDQELNETLNEFGKEFMLGIGIDAGVNVIANLVIPGVKNYSNIFFNTSLGKSLRKVNSPDLDTLKSDAISILKGEIDPTLAKKYRSLGMTEYADSLETMQSGIAKVRALKDAGRDTEAIAKLFAQSNSMDIIPKPGGYGVIKDTLNKKSKIINVGSLEEAMKMIDDKVMKGLKRSNDLSTDMASITKDLQITQVREGVLQSAKADFDMVDFTESILPRHGAFDVNSKTSALGFVKGSISTVGDIDIADLAKLEVRLTKPFTQGIPNVDDILYLPKTINSALEQKNYLKYLTEFVSHHGGDGVDKEKLTSLFDVLKQTEGTWSFRDMDWINAQAGKAGIEIKTDGKAYKLLDGGEELTFGDQEQMANYVYSKSITDEEYANYLKSEKNFQYSKDEELNLIAIKTFTGSPIAHGETIEQIMMENPLLRPKYPLRTGPKLAFINDDVRAVRYDGNSISGSAPQLEDYMRKYKEFKTINDIKDMTKSKMITKTSGTDVLVNIKKRYWRVESPNTGMTPKIIRSEKKLTEYLEKINTKEKKMLQTAREKRAQITVSRAGYIISRADEADQVFKTYEEAMEYTKHLPDQLRTPEIFESDQVLIDDADRYMKDSFKKIDFNNPSVDANFSQLKAASERSYANRFTGNKTALEDATRDTFAIFRSKRGLINSIARGDENFKPAIRLFNDLIEVEKLMQTSKSQFHSTIKDLAKAVPEKERLQLSKLLDKELPKDLWQESYRKLYGEEFTSRHEKFMDIVRGVFDQVAEVNGFGDTLDRIENYFPSFKLISMEELGDESLNAAALAKKAFGRELSDAEQKFFQHMRKSDIATYITTEDPLILMQKYVDDTLKSKVLEPAVKALTDFAESADISDNARATLRDVGKQARGLNDDLFVENMKRLNDEISIAADKGFKTVDSKLNVDDLDPDLETVLSPEDTEVLSKALSKHTFRQNPLNQAMGLVTLNTQAFRPWLPIRNTFQPETHLGPLFGFKAIAQAKKDVSNMGREGWEYLAKNAIFQAKLPQDLLGLTGTGLIKRMNEIGLLNYKMSDDYDRAVGFLAVKNAMDEGISAFNNWGTEGGVNHFMKVTKLYVAPEDIQQKVLGSLRQGDTAGATYQYAQWINSMSFLDYSTIAKPSLYSSAGGKVFGQMGTFAIQTLETRKYMLDNLTKADKATYIARALGGAYALNTAWSEVTGSDVTNFSVFGSMTFAGGPLMQLGFNTLQWIGGTGIDKRRAGANLAYNLENLIYPLFGTGRNLAGGLKELSEGNLRGGLLKVGAFPGKGKTFIEQPTEAPRERKLRLDKIKAQQTRSQKAKDLNKF
jgi:hypothetical protein